MVSASTTRLPQSALAPTTTATDGGFGGARRRRGAGRGDGGGGGTGSGGFSGGGGGGGGNGSGGGGSGSSGGGSGRVVEVAVAVVLVEVQLRSVEALVVANASSSRAPVRPRRPNSFLPHWHYLLIQNVPLFDLDFDAILAAMYALTDSAEGVCYLSVPPDLGIAAAALGASASAAPGAGESAAPGAGESAAPGAGESAAPGAGESFTLDSSASRSFFRDSTTLTPLSQPVAVSLADPSEGPVLAHSSTVLPCPAAPSGLLSGLHLPSFSINLVSGADLQDAWVAVSSQVFAAASRSSPASAPCSCRPLTHETLLWNHRLRHPSLPRLRARVRGQGHDRYFLLVVDDYSRYTTVFPLRSKGDVMEVLIDWIRGARRQLNESFASNLPVLRLHSDRGGEFSSDLLRAFCRAEGIRLTFTLPASPQQNGIAERRIGMVMDVDRTSMIDAAAPHFLWPFAVQYAAHQINLQPRVSLPDTTPNLRADPSLFLRTNTTLPPFYGLVYVNDLVFASADIEALAHVKSKLQKRHTCTDLGELTSYLGLRITRDKAQRTITLTQSHMVQQVLQRFGFTYSLPQSTPLPTGHSLSAPPSDESVEPSGPYPELVGCLMHRMVHWDAAKRVLRYLCSTSGMGLVLGGRARFVLTGHADASWVDDLATQRSSQGYTFSLGSGFVSWRSTRSSSVLSWSCEAVIYAGALAAQELR
ncbi:unnamed protein product [Closterium sp. NIES-54]